MILNDFVDEEVIVIGNDIMEKDFSIVTNKKMFSVLSDKLYSDKILAPIRELSTNAYDSHKKAGKENVPIEVFLPTNKTPEFYVKDCGVGLSHEEVCDIYTVYGASTSDWSNDYVGCLGLGSKSPFAYTDSFILTAVKDGIKNVYMALMELGVPKITRMLTQNTEEGNGVKVLFSVKQCDIRTFYDRAHAFYAFFKPYPVVINSTSKFALQIVHEGKNWFVAREDFGFSSRNFYIVMGNITYTVAIIDFVARLKEHGLNKDLFKNILSWSETLVFNVNIGDFDITVSREELELTRRNDECLLNLLDCFYNELKKKIIGDFNKATGFVEKNSCLNKWLGMFHKLGNEDFILDFFKVFGFVGADGELLATYFNAKDEKTIKRVSYFSNVNFRDVLNEKKHVVFVFSSKKNITKKAFYEVYGKSATCQGFVFVHKKEIVEFLEKNGCVVEKINENMLKKDICVTKRNKYHRKFFVSKYNTKLGEHGFVGAYIDRFWKTECFNDKKDTGGLYVYVDGYNIKWEGKNHANKYLYCDLDLIKRISGKDIYLVRAVVYDEIKNDPNWVCLFDYLDNFNLDQDFFNCKENFSAIFFGLHNDKRCFCYHKLLRLTACIVNLYEKSGGNKTDLTFLNSDFFAVYDRLCFDLSLIEKNIDKIMLYLYFYDPDKIKEFNDFVKPATNNMDNLYLNDCIFSNFVLSHFHYNKSMNVDKNNKIVFNPFTDFVSGGFFGKKDVDCIVEYLKRVYGKQGERENG